MKGVMQHLAVDARLMEDRSRNLAASLAFGQGTLADEESNGSGQSIGSVSKQRQCRIWPRKRGAGSASILCPGNPPAVARLFGAAA
jgi:hypothetical protein